jgi:putative oxidoreductase
MYRLIKPGFTNRLQEEGPMKYNVLVGRLFYAAIFLATFMSHFSKAAVGYAQAQGVPLASIAVPLSGVIAIAGGLSIAAGYRAKWGAGLLILFLVPVTLLMHNFWAVKDPVMAQFQFAAFMKNLGLLGAAMLIIHFGSGPLSLDSLSKKE